MQPVFVLFGTESGNAQSLAKRAGEALTKAGLPVKVIDMMDFAGPDLEKLERLLVITSTYGNGDPPSNAEALHAFLMKKCPPLPRLSFSVCALGDTTYDHFAKCGRDFDERLGALGATRLVDRQDCDVDYDDPFDAWLARVTERLVELASPRAAATASAPPPSVDMPALETPAGLDEPGTRRNPVVLRVIDNRRLGGEGSQKRVHHVALSTAGAPLPFAPGDSIGLWAENDPALVEAVAKAGAAPLDARVTIGGLDTTLRDALTRRLEIQHVDARLVEALRGPLPNEERQALIERSHVVDLLDASPKKLSPAELVDHLRPLAPRLYSVASSPRAYPGELHLMVDILEYQLSGTRRWGVASKQIAERLPVGSMIPAYLHRTPSFRLVPAPTRIVMIGPGTGLAPFRAFLQERKLDGASESAWLFFGARSRAHDYFYGDELEAYVRDRTLAHLDLAFSRDQTEKLYVQHRMLERGRELAAWIAEGAVIYVCGNASRMAPDVHEALVSILRTHLGKSEESARAELAAMAESGRYQRDVY